MARRPKASHAVDLERCLKGGSNHRWMGERALANLPAGVDHRLVERAMKVVLPWYAPRACKDLHDEYVPIAWRVLETARTPEATFLRAYDDLHAGSAWLLRLPFTESATTNRRRVAELAEDETAVAAAQAAVVAHGTEAEELIAVLASDGSDASIDALVDVVAKAVEARDETLDSLRTYLVPFARGRKMTALAAELDDATDERGRASPLQAFAGRLGAPPGKRFGYETVIESREVYMGLRRKVDVWVVLTSQSLPNIALTVSRAADNSITTRWEDGTLERDDLKIGAPESLDDVPRWLAKSARKLKVRWDPTPKYVKGTLRGKARAAALAWLLSSS